MTLDLYGHLFPDQLDEVADALSIARAAAVTPVLPGPDLDGLAVDLLKHEAPGFRGL